MPSVHEYLGGCQFKGRDVCFFRRQPTQGQRSCQWQEWCCFPNHITQSSLQTWISTKIFRKLPDLQIWPRKTTTPNQKRDCHVHLYHPTDHTHPCTPYLRVFKDFPGVWTMCDTRGVCSFRRQPFTCRNVQSFRGQSHTVFI